MRKKQKNGQTKCILVMVKHNDTCLWGAEFGYNKGLEEGRSKWHKVADGDLPKEEAEYPVIF